MPKPDANLVVKWRELAEEGYLYAEIARMLGGVRVTAATRRAAADLLAQARKVLPFEGVAAAK